MIRLIRTVVVQILVVVSLLALAEGVLRLVKVTPTTEIHAVYRPELIGDYEPNLRALNSFFIDRPYTFTTNSQGVRSPRELSLKKPPDTLRILCLGDSFTMGWGVNDEFTYPEQLFQLIKAKHPEIQVEVINVGGIWSNVLDQIDYFREKGRLLEPDLVISQFFSNDIYHEMAREVVSREALRQGSTSSGRIMRYLQKSALYNAAALVKYTFLKQNVAFRDGRKVPLGIRDKIAPNDFNTLLVQPTPQEAGCVEQPDMLFDECATSCISRLWDNYMRGLGILRRDVEAGGAKFLFIAIPDRIQLGRYFNAHSCVLGDYCRREGIAFIDMLPVFRSACMGRVSELYISDGHANEKGNELIAAAIIQTLQIFKRDGTQLVLELDKPKPAPSCSKANRYRLVVDEGKLAVTPIDVQSGFTTAFKVEGHNVAVRDDGKTLGMANEELSAAGVRVAIESRDPIQRLDVVAIPRIFEDTLLHNAATVAMRAGESLSFTPLSYLRSSGSGSWKEECVQIKGVGLPVGTSRIELTMDLVGSAGIKVNSNLDRNAHRVFDIILFQGE